MKNGVTEVKEARIKVPQTEVAKNGMTVASASESSDKTGIGSREKWNKVLKVALLLLWTFISVVAAQFVVGLVLGGLLQLLQGFVAIAVVLNAAPTTIIVNGIASVLSYALALWLVIWVPPRWAANWSLRVKTKNHKIVKKGDPKAAKTSREELGLRGLLTWTDIGLSPIAYLVATLLAAGLTALFSVFPWFDANQVQETGYTIWMSGGERVVAFLILVVLAPIAEELIFRGWLYGRLRREVGTPVAILLVSLLFGLVHFQWNVGVNVFALSVVLCVLREITGTVYAGILTHMLKNGIAFYLLYVFRV